MKKGFTLIELLVVIAILGILSAVVITSIARCKETGKCEQKIEKNYRN